MMFLLFQTVLFGFIGLIAFLALYTLIIFVFNFIQIKKDNNKNSNSNRKNIVIFSNNSTAH